MPKAPWIRPNRPDGYRILNGSYVAPKEGVEWERYDLIEEIQQTDADPITDLLNLDVDDPGQVLSWTRQYGLLGLLPLMCVQVTLWPRWEGPWNDEKGRGSITQWSYYRDEPTADKQTAKWKPLDDLTTGEASPEIGTPLSEDEAAKARKLFGPIQSPTVRMVNPWESEYVHRTNITTGYAPFFPGLMESQGLLDELKESAHELEPADHSGAFWVQKEPVYKEHLEKKTYPFPILDSERFWSDYAEPLDLIQEFIRTLQESVFGWFQTQQIHEHREEEPRGLMKALEIRFFNKILRSVRPQMDHPPKGKPTQGYHFSSLLSVCIWNFVKEDLIEDRIPPRPCVECRTWFRPSRRDKVFCSDKHQNKAQQQRHYHREQLEEKLTRAREALDSEEDEKVRKLYEQISEHHQKMMDASGQLVSEKTHEVSKAVSELSRKIQNILEDDSNEGND